MDVKELFRGISDKLLADFSTSSQIKHKGGRGEYREAALRDFLINGRLPGKYGVGSGEVVSPTKDTSRQSDLLIFDKLNGMSLFYSESIQVYPIESIYGVIEVKSALSKQEFLVALENIRSLKALAPNEYVTHKSPGMAVSLKRPVPFGAVFAYSLGGNSLASLEKNLEEWESKVPAEHWPNLIAVLGEGCIFHQKNLERCVHNNQIKQGVKPFTLSFKKDTLFHFYTTVLDLCSMTSLAPPQLGKYFEPSERMGEFVVRLHDCFHRHASGESFRINLSFLRKVFDWCKARKKISQRDLYLRQFGSIPEGLGEAHLNFMVYHYDPDSLPGIDQFEKPFEISPSGPVPAGRMQVPYHFIEINGEVFCIPTSYLSEDDFEKTSND